MDVDIIARSEFEDYGLRLNGIMSQGLSQSLQTGITALDTFDRPDQPMNLSIPNIGNVWYIHGIASHALIQSGQLISDNTIGDAPYYCYQSNNGNLITHAEVAFSFTSTSTSSDLTQQNLAMAFDNGNIQNLLHLNWGPVSWTLAIGPDPTHFTGLGNGNYNLLTDGTVYHFGLDVNYSTGICTLTLPDGTIFVCPTNATIGVSVVPTYVFIENTGTISTAFPAAFNGFLMGGTGTVGPTLRAFNQAAPMTEITALKGAGGWGCFQRQTIGVPERLTLTNPSAGWFTIAKSTAFGTFSMEGFVKISSGIPSQSAYWQEWEFYVQALYTDTNPTIFQVRGLDYNVGITQARLSTGSSGNFIQLDIFLSRGSNSIYELSVEFEGLFTPVQFASGATALSTGSTVITFGTLTPRSKYNTNSSTSASTILTASNIYGGTEEIYLNLTGAITSASNAQLPTVAALMAVWSQDNPWLASTRNTAINPTLHLRIYNTGGTSSGVWTITTNTGWTLNGTMTIPIGGYRDFIVTITSGTSSTATLQSLGDVVMSTGI